MASRRISQDKAKEYRERRKQKLLEKKEEEKKLEEEKKKKEEERIERRRAAQRKYHKKYYQRPDAREKIKARLRAYRKTESYRKYRDRYWAKYRDRILLGQSIKRHDPKYREQKRNWSKEYRKRIKETMTPEKLAEIRAKRTEYMRAYREKNHDKLLEKRRKHAEMVNILNKIIRDKNKPVNDLTEEDLDRYIDDIARDRQVVPDPEE